MLGKMFIGVQFKNEVYLVNKSHVMASFNQYVPVEESVTAITLNGNEFTMTAPGYTNCYILVTS